MTTIVTGASGHIGANPIRTLLGKGHSVRALIHQNERPLQGLGIETICGDVCNMDSLRHAFTNADVVYNLAAHISISMHDWPTLEKTNIIGTRKVVEACIHCGVRRLIHFSSIHAFTQKPLDIPVNESRPLVNSEGLPYDRSKAAAEQEIRRGVELGLDAIIINPTAIVGPNDYQPSHFGEVLLLLANGKLPALVTGGFNWVDVRDVVNGAISAEERAPKGASYILSGHWVSMREVASTVAELTGVPAPRLECPLWLARLAVPIMTTIDRWSDRRPLYTSASIITLQQSNRHIVHDKATHDLDYHPRPFKETIVDILRWFEATGQLKKPLII
jgi:dihydroflavonol-4-reductase